MGRSLVSSFLTGAAISWGPITYYLRMLTGVVFLFMLDVQYASFPALLFSSLLHFRLETGVHLAEAALIYNQPTVLLKPQEPHRWTYAPNATDWCPQDDWTCFVYPLSSCDASILEDGNGAEWRAPYTLGWMGKYLGEAKLADPHLLDVWNEVINDLGGGRRGLRGLTMIARSWATRPLPWLEHEVSRIIGEQGLQNKTVDGCVAIHLRRSDNTQFHGRPTYSLGSMVELARTVLSPTTEGRQILLLSDTELHEDDLGAVAGLSWTMLHRYRGRGRRAYGDHLPTKNATAEVAYIFAEQELLSRCTSFVHQQGAFAGMLWERMCRAHEGWGACTGTVSRAAICDLCCSSRDIEMGAFNTTEQSCRGERIPDYACSGVFIC